MELQGWLEDYGSWGVLIAMFLESSIIPIPSEAVILAAGYAGIPFGTILWAGTLGSTLGACVGYGIGRSGARWFLDRYGHWIGLTTQRLQALDQWTRRYGRWGVLIGRLIPIVPFKVFSIGAGIGRTPFPGFGVMTALGMIPRILLLTLAGDGLRRATLPTLSVLGLCGLLFVLIRKKIRHAAPS